MITTDDENQIDELRDFMNKKVQAELPAEKARAHEAQTKIAQQLSQEGSTYVPGLGQKIGSIDSRTYFRLQQENPGCMSDPNYLKELLRDSPKLQARGFDPRPKRSQKKTFAYQEGRLVQIA